MTTRPATPLPSLFIGEPTNAPPCSEEVIASGPHRIRAMIDGDNWIIAKAHTRAYADALIHRANSYPRLVEALKYLVAKSNGYPLLQAEMDIPLATSLLRELGELSE